MHDVIKKLTLKEKARMLSGYSNMSTYPVSRLDIPSLNFSDGPNGIRKEKPNGDSLGSIDQTLEATCFPTGCGLAATWNKNLISKVGDLIGKECRYYNINMLLGPAINIKRNPKCGRNFEYYSEDPILSGEIAKSFINGLQAHNVGACIKHFACNNNEKYRFTGDSILSKRALFDIYLKPFEIALEAKPMGLMSSYNKINGVHASENEYVLKDILRDRFKFDGLSMTDWGGIKDRVLGLKATTDLEMPGQVEHNVKLLVDAVKDNLIDESLLDESVDRILTTIDKTRLEPINYDFNEGYLLAKDVLTDAAVLLKNENNILPINKNKKYLVVGELFEEIRYQGSGSSLLNPYKLSYHKECFDKENINYEYKKGYLINEFYINSALEDDAINTSKDYDTVICYLGQNDYVESEGFDRETLKLPENQISLLVRLIELGKKVIVVLFGGSAVEIPYIEKISGLIYMTLGGEGIGEGTTDLLLGKVSPSGRLVESWPYSYSDVPFNNEFTLTPNELYKEDIYVGYRYYSSINKKVMFPFGYGLSYSSFDYSNLKVNVTDLDAIISLTIKNIGNVKAKEVIQIYSSKKDSKIYRPKTELKGFDKVELLPNESKDIKIKIPLKRFEIYDVNSDTSLIEDGEYEISINKSSDDVILSTLVNIKGEKILPDEVGNRYYLDPNNLLKINNNEFEHVVGYEIKPYEFNKKPITMETPIGEFTSFIGGTFKKIVCGIAYNKYKKAFLIEDPKERERQKKAGLFIYKLLPSNSLRSLSFSSSGQLPYKVALGLMEMSNGHLLKAIKAFIIGVSKNNEKRRYK